MTADAPHRLTDHLRFFAFDAYDARFRLRGEVPDRIVQELAQWNRIGWLADAAVKAVGAELLSDAADRERLAEAVARHPDVKTAHTIHIDRRTAVDQTILLAGPIRALDKTAARWRRGLARYGAALGSQAAGLVTVLGSTRAINSSAFPLVLDLDVDTVLPARNEVSDEDVDSRVFALGKVDRQRLVDRFNEISRGKSYYTRRDFKHATEAPSIFIKAAEFLLLHEVAAQVNRDGEKVMTLASVVRFFEGSLLPEITRQRVQAWQTEKAGRARLRAEDVERTRRFFELAGGPEAALAADEHEVTPLALENVTLPSAGGKHLEGGLNPEDLGLVNADRGKCIDWDRTCRYWQQDKAVGREGLLRPIWWAVTGNRFGR